MHGEASTGYMERRLCGASNDRVFRAKTEGGKKRKEKGMCNKYASVIK